jgi:type II secretory pathway component PulC
MRPLLMKRSIIVLGCLGTLSIVSLLAFQLAWLSSKPVPIEPDPRLQNIVPALPSSPSALPLPLRARVTPPSANALAPLQAKLLWTVVEADSSSSRAFVRETLTKRQLTLALGEALQGRTLSHIARGFVRLRRADGAEELLTIEDTTSADAIIQSRGADEYHVDKRRLVDAIKGDVRALWAQGRLNPRIEQFQLAGFELSEVRPESFIEQAGLKSHDVLTAVNGKPLSSFSAAFAAYDSARHSKDIAVEVNRQGDHYTLRYVIREDPLVNR